MGHTPLAIERALKNEGIIVLLDTTPVEEVEELSVTGKMKLATTWVSLRQRILSYRFDSIVGWVEWDITENST